MSEVADAQELGDQEGRGPHHRRGRDRAHAARGQEPAGVVAVVAGLGQHRIGDRADRDGVGHPGARGHCQEVGGGDDGAAGRGGLAAHRGEGKVHVEFARTADGQEGAEDAEPGDDGRADVDRHPEDPFERHVHVADDALEVVAAVRPRGGQPGADVGVGQEQDTGDRHDQPGRAPGGLQDQQQEEDPQHHVGRLGGHGAVDEVLEVDQHPADAGEPESGEREVDPGDPALVPRPHRVVEEAERKQQRDEDAANDLSRHGHDRGVERKERHPQGERGDDLVPQPLDVAGGPFLLFHQLFELLLLVLGQVTAWFDDDFRHGSDSLRW